MRRHLRTVACVLVAATVALAGCRTSTIRIAFAPAVGDRYRVRSQVDTEIARTVAGTVDHNRATSHLDATERVVGVHEHEVSIEVTVQRDGDDPRTYEASLDPTGRLSSIDLVEGVPAEALGLDLASDLPASISSPPTGPLAPGATWRIEQHIPDPGGGRPLTVTGTGRLTSLGVEHGDDVAVVVVELDVPVRSVTETEDGRVTVRGSQRVFSRTTYALSDGTARTDRTRIEGEAKVTVDPPAGIVAPPVDGSIHYSVVTETHRVRAS